jgi:hypothetical protein
LLQLGCRAQLPLSCRSAAAQLPLSCRLAADAVWSAAVWGSLVVASRPIHVDGRNIFRADYGECCRERTAMCCRLQRLSLLCAGARLRWLPGDRLGAHGVRRQSCAGFSWRKSDDITQYQVRGFLVIWCSHNCRIFLTTAGSLLFFAGPCASSTTGPMGLAMQSDRV